MGVFIMEWRQIEGFPQYVVSDTGLVQNVTTGRTLKPYCNGNGYLKVTLCNNGVKSRHFVHRLVGFAFVEGYKTGYTIDHIDTNRTNNTKSNLRWMSLAENVALMHKNHKKC